MAAKNGHLEVARLLLDSRADPNAAKKVPPVPRGGGSESASCGGASAIRVARPLPRRPRVRLGARRGVGLLGSGSGGGGDGLIDLTPAGSPLVLGGG